MTEANGIPGRAIQFDGSARDNFSSLFARCEKGSDGVAGETISPLPIPWGDGTLRAEDGDDGPLQQLAPFYTIKRKLASGGFCDIYLAHDNSLNREIVIKTLQETKNSKYSERNAFLTEAKISALLSHPNIIPVYGIYTDAERNLFLAMKWIQGRPLKALLRDTLKLYKTTTTRGIAAREKTQLPLRLEMFLKVCDAVSYAHHRGVLHRDLKPENIMIGEFSEVYVMDWGIAEYRNINTLSKHANHMAGTMLYLAPEIVTGKFYDSRSDIYALGAILFELVFLQAAYPRRGHLARDIAAGRTTPFRHRFRCSVPGELKRIVAKAIHRSPDARYQTVKLLADDLRQFLLGRSEHWWEKLSFPALRGLFRR